MYPVYDLSTEGGKQAFFEQLTGFGPGGMADSFFPYNLEQSNPSDNHCVFRQGNYNIGSTSGMGLSFQRLLDRCQGATPQSPIESPFESMDTDSQNAVTDIMGRLEFLKFGQESDPFYAAFKANVPLSEVVLLSTDDRALDLEIEVHLSRVVNHGISFSSFVVVLGYDGQNLRWDGTFHDTETGDPVDPSTLDLLVVCTQAGKFVCPNFAEETCASIGLNCGIIFSDTHYSSPVGDVVESGGDVCVEDDGLYLAFCNSSSINILVPESACPSTFSIESDDFDSLGTIDILKTDHPEFDWDHPITGNDEEIGLSATKKHFIVVS